jgi:hypothetical protein
LIDFFTNSETPLHEKDFNEHAQNFNKIFFEKGFSMDRNGNVPPGVDRRDLAALARRPRTAAGLRVGKE